MNLRKLLNIEKRSQKELLKRQNMINHAKPSKESQTLRNNIKQIEEENKILEKKISSLYNKVIIGI
jgi:hypothetical protein